MQPKMPSKNPIIYHDKSNAPVFSPSPLKHCSGYNTVIYTVDKDKNTNILEQQQFNTLADYIKWLNKVTPKYFDSSLQGSPNSYIESIVNFNKHYNCHIYLETDIIP